MFPYCKVVWILMRLKHVTERHVQGLVLCSLCLYPLNWLWSRILLTTAIIRWLRVINCLPNDSCKIVKWDLVQPFRWPSRLHLSVTSGNASLSFEDGKANCSHKSQLTVINNKTAYILFFNYTHIIYQF